MRCGPALIGWLAALILLTCSPVAPAAFPADAQATTSDSDEAQSRMVSAAAEGNVELVERFLRAGVPSSSRGAQMSAIEAAAGNGHVEVWRLLVDAGALRGADQEIIDSLAEAATVLGHLFPRDAAVFEALAEESSESRLWAGIHFRSDLAAGRALGRAVAERVLGWSGIAAIR